MPLRISLGPGERLVVGGAVIRCAGAPAQILIENKVPVLREKDIIPPEGADTLAKRLYFVIQLMYMDADNLADHYAAYWPLAYEVERIVPDAASLIAQINRKLFEQDFYKALRLAKKLIQLEKQASERLASR